MENLDIYIAIMACILLLGVALNRFSKFLKMPILICFLGVGILFGQHGLNIFPPVTMQQVQVFGEIALAYIMFSGGLQTSLSSIRKVLVTGTILSTIGVILTALLLGFFTFWLSHSPDYHTIDLPTAILIGAIFSSTDAAAVFAILRGQKAAISPKLQSLLEYESGSNDPAAFLLTSIMLEIIWTGNALNVQSISGHIALGILWGLGIGSAVGLLFGLFGQWFYNWIHNFLEYNGLRFVVAIAIVLLCFACTKAIFQANALMACYVAGITMGNLRFNFKQSFCNFQDGISWLMQIMLFTILGSFFDYRMFFSLDTLVPALTFAIALMFVIRPVVVMLCMIKSPFSMRERIFTSWVGIRGSAPIMLAALALATLPEDHAVGPQALFYVVFVVVLLSILLQGSTLMWVAKKLKLMLPYEEKEELPFSYDEKSDGREMYLFSIARDSVLVDRKLSECTLENGPVLLMIKRGNQYLQPHPDFRLQAGDALSFIGPREAMQQLHQEYFPQEPYDSLMTFRQAWKKLMKKYRHRNPHQK